MLSALEIENFRGIASRQRVAFTPVTLLVGANGAGKSTVLQAMLYLHELLEHGTADDIDHGEFSRLVHRHDTNRAIVLRAELATPRSLGGIGRGPVPFPLPDAQPAWLELTVRHRATATFRGPIVERARIGVGGCADSLVEVEVGASLREDEPLYARVNLGHPILAHVDPLDLERFEQLAIAGHTRALPVFAISRSRLSALPPADEPLHVIVFGDQDEARMAIANQLRTFLEMIILGTTAQLAAALRDTLYIGPLRTIPPRGFLYERAGRLPSWADGLAAWDLLLADRTTLVERTNHWLRRLGAGCQVTVQSLFDSTASAEDLSIDHVDRTVRRLLLDTGTGSLVLPSEVGAGVSQVLPVIVAALQARTGLALVEQPELHVHPAVQVGLGDLFIEATTGDSARRLMLVETHSEHLILRLLRRIRETTDNELPKGAPAFSSDALSVLYVEAHPDGVRIRRLRVDDQGEFTDRWPKGFFAERMEELL